MKTIKRTALLLILHGSPNEEANSPAVALAAQLQTDPQYERVMVAYMECNAPSIPAAIDQLAAAGIQRIIAIPWFLHAGRHLILDVPELLESGGQKYHNLEVLIANPIGTSQKVSEAIHFRAQEALSKTSG